MNNMIFHKSGASHFLYYTTYSTIRVPMVALHSRGPAHIFMRYPDEKCLDFGFKHHAKNKWNKRSKQVLCYSCCGLICLKTNSCLLWAKAVRLINSHQALCVKSNLWWVRYCCRRCHSWSSSKWQAINQLVFVRQLCCVSWQLASHTHHIRTARTWRPI